MTTQEIIVCSFLVLAAMCGIYTFVLIMVARPYRQAELQSYWDAFHSTVGCPESLKFFLRGCRIHRIYRLRLPEGCVNEKAFHDAAIQALRLAVAQNEDSETALKLRADLARLILINASDEEKAVAANKFVTQS